MQGGGGPLLGITSGAFYSHLSSRTCFGIWQTLRVECNAGQMLKRVQHDRKGFTMAEILLSLTIIGVVAAITLPSLTGNINERTWNTQRKALYARFSQAISLMPALNGYGTLTEDSSSGASDAVDTVAETFITDGLSKVLKINNICDSEHLADCGIPAKIIGLNGDIHDTPDTLLALNSNAVSAVHGSYTYSTLNTKAAAFETQNGESILLFYNPNCVSNMGETSWYMVQPKICANMIFDLNGNKGPNTMGKDIGIMTVLYPTDSAVVAPEVYRERLNDISANDAPAACTNKVGSEYRIATKDELAAIFINKNLLGVVGSPLISSSSKVVLSGGRISRWGLNVGTGLYQTPFPDDPWSMMCVKR